MRKICLFMMVSTDGFFEGVGHDLSWHIVDDEFNAFAAKQLDAADMLLFGHRTYELMASYWPKEIGKSDDSGVATKMNSLPKLVFSKQHFAPEWAHTRLVQDTEVGDELTKLKQQPGRDLLVLGSSNLCVSLLEQQLLDELRLMVNPVILGHGTRLFTGLDQALSLDRQDNRSFASGNVLLTYQPRYSA